MRTIVIGGGAGGLMAAFAAARRGAEVLLLEKNEKLGKKIYITGKGRCNLTNDCSPDAFLQNVVRGEKFLRSAIYRFPPSALMELLSEHGLKLKVERGNRVFPVSDHASDVTKTLEKMCKEVGVTVHLNTEVQKIDLLHSTMSDIITSKGSFSCDSVVLATGGLSYPSTGSTGDGYRFAKEIGHAITPCVPALSGLELCDSVSQLMGISVKNARLTLKRGEKTLFSEFGELLFTHYGISGPIVLTLSSKLNRMDFKELSLSLDLKPALSYEQLEKRILSDLLKRKNEQMKSVMRGLLPAGLSLFVLQKAQILPTLPANALTKEERKRLCFFLKNLPLRIKCVRGFDEAVVTSGGVELSGVDPKTMQSKLDRRIFFAGEVLDVDALTGGFNLQIAFSTGYLAGSSVPV